MTAQHWICYEALTGYIMRWRRVKPNHPGAATISDRRSIPYPPKAELYMFRNYIWGKDGWHLRPLKGERKAARRRKRQKGA